MLRRGIEALGLELLVKDEYIASSFGYGYKSARGSGSRKKIVSFSKKEGIAITGGDREALRENCPGGTLRLLRF